MKLYFAPRTRSVRPRWILEELEVPYELVRLDLSKGEGDVPEYRALHPFGEAPAFVDGEVALFESSALCLYLADRFPEKRLAPPLESPDRAAYLQWLLFAEVELEPVVLEFYRASQQADLTKHRARLNEVLRVLDARLEGREFVTGTTFTAADVVLASILHLANTLKLLDAHPGLFDYVLRHTRRPAARRAVSL